MIIGGLKFIGAGSSPTFSGTVTANNFLTSQTGTTSIAYGQASNSTMGIAFEQGSGSVLFFVGSSEFWRVSGSTGGLVSNVGAPISTLGGLFAAGSGVPFQLGTTSCGISTAPNSLDIYGGAALRLNHIAGLNLGTSGVFGNIPATANITSAPVSSSGSASTLMTYTLAANALVQAGRGLRVTAWGHTTNSANAKSVSLAFGSQTIMTKALAVSLANGLWRISAEIVRTGLSTQQIFAEGWNDDATTVSGTDGPTVLYAATQTSGTQTETSAIVIKGVATTATTTEITQDGLIVELL